MGVNSACGDLVGEKRIAIFAPEMSSLLLSFVKRWAGLAGYISLARTCCESVARLLQEYRQDVLSFDNCERTIDNQRNETNASRI